jgi:hypothetical protein
MGGHWPRGYGRIRGLRAFDSIFRTDYGSNIVRAKKRGIMRLVQTR